MESGSKSTLKMRSRTRQRRQQRRVVDNSLRQWLAIVGLFLLLPATRTGPFSAVVQAFSASSSPSSNLQPTSTNGQAPVAQGQELPQRLKIAFVTGNAIKTREMKLLLEQHTKDDQFIAYNNCNNTPANYGEDNNTAISDDSSLSQSFVDLRVVQVDLPEIQEVDTEAIAKEKALLGAQLAGGPCVVEDTSLQFTALGGMPGPYIKWFQDRLGNAGLWNILQAYDDKSAQAVCTLAFCPAPHADPVLFTGITHGTIVEPVPGRGFGWDSIFVPHDASANGTPYSCLTMEQKNQSSHRGKAVRQWAAWLRQNRQELWERQTLGKRSIGHKGLDFKARSVEE